MNYVAWIRASMRSWEQVGLFEYSDEAWSYLRKYHAAELDSVVLPRGVPPVVSGRKY